MNRLKIMVCLLALTASARGFAHSEEPLTERAVANAITEYVHAKYARDAEGVMSRAHPNLARRAVTDRYWGEPSAEWVRPYTREMLQFYGTEHNAVHHENVGDGRLQIEVFDVYNKSASASVLMDDVFDLLHLAHVDGRWVIVDSAVTILERVGAPAPGLVSGEAAQDEADVRGLVERYCRGFYLEDPDMVQGTCHPMLSKRMLHEREGVDYDTLRRITFEEIRLLALAFNAAERIDPEHGRVQVEVYHLDGQTAAAKLVGETWFDYLQLLKVNGEWTIVNIIFEPLAPVDWGDAPRV